MVPECSRRKKPTRRLRRYRPSPRVTSGFVRPWRVMCSKRNICDRFVIRYLSFRTNQSNYLHVGFQFSFIVEIASCNVERNESACKSELCCIHECKLVNSRQGGGRTWVASVRVYVCLRLSIPIAGLLDPPNPDLAPAPLPRHTCTAAVPHELRPRRDAAIRA